MILHRPHAVWHSLRLRMAKSFELKPNKSIKSAGKPVPKDKVRTDCWYSMQVRTWLSLISFGPDIAQGMMWPAETSWILSSYNAENVWNIRGSGNHPAEVLHLVFINTHKLIFREWCDQLTYDRNQFIWRAAWCSRHSFLERSKKEEVTRKSIWTVSWGRNSTGFCCRKSCLTFAAVVRPGTIQMDHNSSKSFLRTLLTDVFQQIRNNRFDKEGCIVFHAFRNIQQTFDHCATLNNQNEALFGLNLCFGISCTSSGFAAQHEWWKYSKEPAFVRC
jgi:hypothetical protein